MVLKFCPNLSFLFQETTSLLKRYDLAREAGFKGVECSFPYDHTPEEIAKAKTQAGVEQVLINAYPGDWSKGERGLAAIPNREHDFKLSVEKSVSFAEKLDCKRIHIMAGTLERETPENLEIYIRNLKFAADLLSRKNMVGLIEPINKFSMPNYFLNSNEKALSVIQEINSSSIKLQLDIFHLQQIDGNLTRNIEKFLPVIGHIQVAQVPDRHEPDTPGEIDFKYLFYLLERLNYNGWIGLEYIPKSKTKEGLQWIDKFGLTL